MTREVIAQYSYASYMLPPGFPEIAKDALSKSYGKNPPSGSTISQYLLFLSFFIVDSVAFRKCATKCCSVRWRSAKIIWRLFREAASSFSVRIFTIYICAFIMHYHIDQLIK